MKRFTLKIVWCVLGCSLVIYAQTPLTLSKLLDEIKIHHEYVIGAKLTKSALRKESMRETLLTAPSFFTNWQYGDESKVSLFSAIQGARIESINTQTGVKWVTDSGYTATAQFQWAKTTLPDAKAGGDFNLPSTYYESIPSLQVTKSLWRNASGEEVQLSKDIIKKNVAMGAYSEDMAIAQVLESAELAYWRVLSAKSIVKVREKTLDRAIQIFNWLNKKVSQNLGDQSDLLQGRASVKLRELELEMATSEADSAQRALNGIRGQTQLVQIQNIPDFSAMYELAKEGLPTTFEPRSEFLRTKAQFQITSANISLQKSQLQPQLDLTLSLASNHWETNFGDSFGNVLSVKYPGFSVGIAFVSSLDHSAVTTVLSGLEQKRSAQEMILARQYLDQRRAFEELIALLEATEKQVELAKKIEKIQQEKAISEAERQRIGRTTLYQVLMFEQDYAQAQAVRIQAQMAVVTVAAKLRHFRGKP